MDEQQLIASVTDGNGFILCLREEDKKGNCSQNIKYQDKV